ncbi:hypothetical protein AB0E66_37365 [Streptomyces sp. NPDC033753]|uniref:hypothetical protein n=1 Tax=Streptomyces sp. NPDC033753 TaxID=3155128 RepID=UPI0033DD81AB
MRRSSDVDITFTNPVTPSYVTSANAPVCSNLASATGDRMSTGLATRASSTRVMSRSTSSRGCTSQSFPQFPSPTGLVYRVESSRYRPAGACTVTVLGDFFSSRALPASGPDSAVSSVR